MGAVVRKGWSSWHADFIDQEPVVSLEEILGGGMPSDVIGRFHSEPDEIGIIDWFEVDRCPLSYIDSNSPHYDPGWLVEAFEAVGVLNMNAPHSWLPVKPSGAFRDAVVMIKSEQDHAAAYRSKHSEEW